MSVKAKKHLGQHFLTDENIAKKIANSRHFSGYDKVLEVGPGMGVLTKYLLEKETETFVAEIDTESIAYLKEHYPQLKENHFVGDFLKTDFSKIFPNEQVAVIGNFPYNISSQILFHIIENYQQIPEMAGMFQKKEAEIQNQQRVRSQLQEQLKVLTEQELFYQGQVKSLAEKLEQFDLQTNQDAKFDC